MCPTTYPCEPPENLPSVNSATSCIIKMDLQVRDLAGKVVEVIRSDQGKVGVDEIKVILEIIALFAWTP